jgi:hypothetical protein
MKGEKKMKKLYYLIVLTVLLLGLVLNGSSQSLVLLDEVNIGNTASEELHTLVGWSNIWSGCTWCGPDGNMRLIWGDGGETCDAGNNWASVELDAGALYAKTLRLNHLDGAADDGFDIYVNTTYVGTYVANIPNTDNVWHVTDFDISSYNFSGLLTIKFEATAPAWSLCATYGQVAFNLIELYGPYPVAIDIKPGSDPNSINPNEQGVLPVAILGSSIDVSTIDLTKPITLGGAAVTSRGSAKKTPKLAVSFEDVDGDELMDLVAFFRVQDLVDSGALDGSTTELMLEAETMGGVPIYGTDAVSVVP